jgi:alpha-D-xyloside xylohydrolase
MAATPYDAPPGFVRLTRVDNATIDGDSLHLGISTASGGQVQVIFQLYARDVWHWTFLPEGSVAPPPTGIVCMTPGPGLSLTVRETATTLTVGGGDLTLYVRRDPWSFCFADASGREVFRDNPGDIDGLGRPFVLPMGVVEDDGSVRQVVFSFHLEADEHLFGLGEKFTAVDKIGQKIISWTQDAFGSTSERSHKNIPFLLSTRGYGLLLDTGARITWDLGMTSCQSASVASTSSSLSGYIIGGDTPAAILSRYADLTGHAPVPPKWSFGLWVSSGGTYRDRRAMEQLIDGLEQHGIPADVVHVDPWWMKWRTYCDFRWDTTAFPDPEGFIRSLHERGLKLCLWEHPYISVESDLFAEGAKRGYFLKRSDGSVYVIDYGLSLAPRPDGVVREATPENSWNAQVAIVDLTRPDACAWFQDLHRPLLRMGVDVFKTDFGEDIPVDALFANGQTGSQMHNLYPLIYNQVVAEVTRQEHGQGMVWGRSGTAGSQRTPVCWSGDPAADFESLACTIRGGLSIGFSGVPFWSNDIGGYRGMPDKELFVRWAQFGLFCSHSRMHGDSPREPWHFGEVAMSIVRTFVSLRYQLFPYHYSCAHEAHHSGMPVLRAMTLAFPDDPNTYDKDLQFMLGPWFLVAPIVTRSGKRTVYLPEGKWYDYWNGRVSQGPCTLKITSPLAALPLYIRAGAIIPMMLPAQRIPSGVVDPLILDVYPADASLYVLHEDEGDTRFLVRAIPAGYSLEWSGPVVRQMVFRVHSGPPDDGVKVPFAAATAGASVAVRSLDDTTIELRPLPARQGTLALTDSRE